MTKTPQTPSAPTPENRDERLEEIVKRYQKWEASTDDYLLLTETSARMAEKDNHRMMGSIFYGWDMALLLQTVKELREENEKERHLATTLSADVYLRIEEIAKLKADLGRARKALERLCNGAGFVAIGMYPRDIWGDELRARHTYAEKALKSFRTQD